MEIDALKEQLRQAMDKLTVRRRRVPQETSNGHARVWNMKLQMAMEQNHELENRLAWEIEHRTLVEQYTREQIRQLQDILDALLRQQLSSTHQLANFADTPPSQPAPPMPVAHYYPPQPAPMVAGNNLSPLLTEVMHVQLKFAETMQSLNQSVQTRDHLLFATPPHRHGRPVDDESDDDTTQTLPMTTYTAFLNREDTPPSLRSPPPRPPVHPSTMSTPEDHHDDVSTPGFTSPWHQGHHSDDENGNSATPATDESKRSVHFPNAMDTPTVGRAISFQDCNDDDESHNSLESCGLDAIDGGSITSSALDRSSFLAEFNDFRQSLGVAKRLPPPPSGLPPVAPPSPPSMRAAPAAAAFTHESYMSKAQWSLEAQRLSAERALLLVEQSGTPTQLQQLDDAIEYARSQVLKFS
ncbi:Aste57867_25114 [Aphanomyces stellatus]|uniref:Aste57867_25114 protein n=1 Tax=Aphanomyces stellatus TaxID=120398 RepID=A0A485LSD0_9STRA|nr:hypothetical protein As57867_025036 [Aphanomyces stellatus]VFU01745.1 Aste57867_25114 [Aphanomyces stellatus]